MEKVKKSYQILKLLLVSVLIIITPLLSKSLRFKYLYLVVNVIIVAVGAEAGLLSFFLKCPQNTIVSDNYAADREKTADEPDSGTKTERVSSESSSQSSIFFIGGSEGSEVEDEFMGDNEGEELFQKAETFIGNFYKQLKMQKESSSSSNKLQHLS